MSSLVFLIVAIALVAEAKDEPESCRSVDCTKDGAVDLCPKTCSPKNKPTEEEETCKYVDCSKPTASRDCPKTCPASTKDWTKVADKKECDGSEDNKGPKKTLAECAEECRGISSMFIYGTNDFGTSRCKKDEEDCECFCEISSKDGKCENEIDNPGYRLYKYKDSKEGKECDDKLKDLCKRMEVNEHCEETRKFEYKGRDVMCTDKHIIEGPYRDCRDQCAKNATCNFYAYWKTTNYCMTFNSCKNTEINGEKSIDLWKKIKEN